VLHLCGHDHHVPAQRRRMEREERRLAHVIGMPWPYDERKRRA
jgi:ssRNA-specific RNase YbeY (16S rRNA maturation enzyme)